MTRLVFVAVAIAALTFGVRASQAPAKHRLLYLTHSAAFKHSVLPVSEEVVRDLGRSSDAFEATITQDCGLLTAENLRNYDVVFFYTTGELPMDESQKRALLEFVRSGKGFVGAHSATDTFYKWPEYGEMIGGYFNDHPWHQEVKIKVEDPNHPATKHLPSSFTLKDEIYQYKDWSRSKVHVLLSLDVSSVDLTNPRVKRDDKDFALSWTKSFGQGRVFYTGLGHEPDVWHDPRFQQHLLGGIRWAMGEQ